MQAKHVVALFVMLGPTILAQSLPVTPVGTFDLQLERRAGPGASVAFFVVRNLQLYFVVIRANGSLAFRTNADGTVQSMGSLGAEPVSGFDVDEAGDSFVLQRSSRLTEFGKNWGIIRTLTLPVPITSFALVDGRPMGVGPDSRLAYLDTQEPGFTLEAYPPPWELFTAGAGRLGILRPEASTLQVLHGEDGISTTWLGKDISAYRPFAAAGGPGDKIYLLGSPGRDASVSVIECEDYIRPGLIFHLALPDAFHPRMIGIGGRHIYIVDPDGKVAFYPLDPKSL